MLFAVCAIFAVFGAAYGDAVGNVAFMVTNDNADSLFKKDNAVLFNKVVTSHGNGFDNATGIFTAPKTGLYAFHFYAMTSQSSSFQLRLYHNEEYIVSAYANAGVFSYETSGSSAVLKLKKSDRVYLKPASDIYLFADSDETYATFSGYLVSAQS